MRLLWFPVAILNFVLLGRSFALQCSNARRRHTHQASIFPLLMSLPDDVFIPEDRAKEALLSSKRARTLRTFRSNRGSNLVSSRNTAVSRRSASKRTTGSKQENYENKRKHQSRNDIPYELALEALQTYHSIHGDLVIPRRYKIPSDDRYPEEWHGLDISSTVYDMKWWQKNVKQRPERVAELNKLGFVWERLQPEWNLVLAALVTYSSIYGNVLVPAKFLVPHGDSRWPKATWEIPLGNCVYRIRTRNDFLRGNAAVARREQLDGLGFIWDVHEHRYQKFYAALQQYAILEKCGTYSTGKRTRPLKVPAVFVVPACEHWPKEFWGYPLGEKCSAVQHKALYVKEKPERRKALEELGFRSSGNADLGWLKVVHAAAIFSQLNGRKLDVPYHFVVPAPRGQIEIEGSWPWPEYLWGLPLGQRLKDVRTKGAYLSGDHASERRRQLDALGFCWKPKRGRPRRSIQHGKNNQ